MKDYYLLLSFCFIGMIWVGNFYSNLIVIASFVSYYFFKFRKQWGWVILLLLLFNVTLLPKAVEIPTSKMLHIQEVKSSYLIATSQHQKVYVYNVANVSPNDIIEVEGSYEPIYSLKNIGIVSFEQSSKQKHIHYQIYAKHFSIKAKSNSVKALLFQKIAAIKQERVRSFLQKMLYGIDDPDVDHPTLLYVSGFHLRMLVKRLARWFKWDQNVVGLCVSLIYVSCFTFSFFAVYLCLRCCTNILYKAVNDKNRFGSTVLLLLFYDPMYVYHFGFWVIFGFTLFGLFNVAKIPRFFIGLLILIPLQLFFFYRLQLVSILLFGLLQSFGTILFITALLLLCFPALEPIFLGLLGGFDEISRGVISSITMIGKPSFLWLAVWAIMSVGLLSKIKKKTICVMFILLLYHHNMAKLNLFGEVMFLDVGQGDCILIHEPWFGKTMLIDVAGSLKRDLASDVIYPVLYSKGIHTLDYVVITHNDYDHMGGLAQLETLLEIKEVIRETTKIELDGIVLHNLNLQQYEEENDKSIVLFGSIYGIRYMFCGDAGAVVEQAIIGQYNRLRVDVLKISHHGSHSGSSKPFLQTIAPWVGIVSSGKNNAYGHPHEEVLERFEKQRTILFNTQDHGSVSFYFSRYVHFMRTADAEFGIMKKVKK